MNKMAIAFITLITTVIPVKAQEIQSTRIAEDVVVIHGGGGNITAVRTDSGIVVIDSFVSPKAAGEARRLIIESFPGIPIKLLINTHHHADHVRGNQHFRDGLIIGHVNLEKHMMDGYDANKEAKTYPEEFVPTPPSLRITSDTILTLGGKTFKILYSGTGHTDSDLIILSPEDNSLIMGDLLFRRKCYIMSDESDVGNWITILNNMIERSDEYKWVIPGHGAVVANVDALAEQRDYLNRLWDAVTDAHHRGLTLDQAKEEIKLERYKAYIDYDRIGLDIEACWHQLER